MTAIIAATPEGQPSEEGSSPLVRLQRVAVKFVRELFAGCPPGAYHWEEASRSQDQEGSEIWIGTEYPINPSIVAKRPAVVIGRGPAAFQGIGIGDQAFFDQVTGGFVKMDMMPVTLTVSVLSRVGFEAEELGFFIMKYMWSLRTEMMRGNNFIMYMGQRPSISPPSPPGALLGGLQSDSDWVAVTVSFPVFLQHMEVVVPLNKPILREVTFTATVERPTPPTPASAFLGTSAVGAALPQTDSSEAQSAELLTVHFKT